MDSNYSVESARVQIRANEIYTETHAALRGNALYYKHICGQIAKQQLAVDKIWAEITFLKRIGDPISETLTQTHSGRFDNLENLQRTRAQTALEMHQHRELMLHAVRILQLNPYNNVLPKSRSIDLTDPNTFPDDFDEEDIHWINEAALYYRDIAETPLIQRLKQAQNEQTKEES